MYQYNGKRFANTIGVSLAIINNDPLAESVHNVRCRECASGAVDEAALSIEHRLRHWGFSVVISNGNIAMIPTS